MTRGRARDAAARPHVESLPWLGTTWYERGPAYWFRRALLSLFFLVLLALYGGIIFVIETGIDDPTASAVFVSVTVLCTGLSAVWYLRRQHLARVARTVAEARDRRDLRRLHSLFDYIAVAGLLAGLALIAGMVLKGPVGTALMRIAHGVLALIVGLVLVGSVWATGGAFAVVFAQTLAPELVTEREARRRLARHHRRSTEEG